MMAPLATFEYMPYGSRREYSASVDVLNPSRVVRISTVRDDSSIFSNSSLCQAKTKIKTAILLSCFLLPWLASVLKTSLDGMELWRV